MEVNKKQLADIFGASIRTIQNWQEQGMPVLRGGGCIDSLEVRKKPGGHWIIRDLAGLDLVGLASL